MYERYFQLRERPFALSPARINANAASRCGADIWWNATPCRM